MDRQLGEIRRADDGRWVLRFERRLAHPPEKVWSALTESEHLRHWMPADLVGERREGAPLELPFWPDTIEKYGDRIDTPVMQGEVRVWDPLNVFEWTWDADVVRWELKPTGEGTQLTLITWLGDPDGDPADPAAGYDFCLEQLAELLDRGSTTKPDDAAIERRQREYAAIV